MQEYYKAYDKRYQIVHKETGNAWAGEKPSKELKSILEKYGANENSRILEIGCGEGQNALFLQEQGFSPLATDVSQEAIKWCKQKAKERNLNEESFCVLDILDNDLKDKFDFVLSISTLHMLVLEKDRKAFFDFICSHLEKDGYAIITSMGDGKTEQNKSVLSEAFDLDIRPCGDGTIMVPKTSCRIVNWQTLLKEISLSSLEVVDHYISTTISGFNSSMLVILKKKN